MNCQSTTRPRNDTRSLAAQMPGGRRWLAAAVVAMVASLGLTARGQSVRPFPDDAPAAAHRRVREPSPQDSSLRPAASSASSLSDARPISPAGRPASAGSGNGRKSAAAGPSLWKTCGALAVVIGLIVAAGRLWKKHGHAIAGGLPGEAIEVLGKRSVDARQSIHLVRLGARILVLGSSAAGLRTLAEITDAVEVDTLAGLCRRHDAETGVAQSFRALFGGRPAADADANRSAPANHRGEAGSDSHTGDRFPPSRAFSEGAHV